jgi:glycosyltransferase involved in cell wall biosynthesis
VLQTIAEHMTKFFDVYVACPAIGRTFNEHNGVRIFEVNAHSAFREFVRKLSPDILFCNMIYNQINTENLDFYAELDCFKVMNPIGGPFGLEEKWLRSILRRVGETFDAFVEVDCESSDYLRDTKFVPPQKIRVIPQGVNPEEFNSLPDKDMLRHKYGIKEPNYFFSGQGFWKWKNQSELVRIFRQFQMHDVGLVVSGHSSFTDGSVAQVRQAAEGDSRIYILPDIPRQDFLGLIKHSIAHCSRSKIEGPQPNIMLESGFLEVPYLTSTAGNRWSEEHYSHILVAEEPSKYLEMLNRLSTDGGLRQSVGRAGHQSLLQIGATWTEVLRAYEKLFLSVLSGRKKLERSPQNLAHTEALGNWWSSRRKDTEIKRLMRSEEAKQQVIIGALEMWLSMSFSTLARCHRLLDIYCGPSSYLARLRTKGLKEGVDPSVYPEWVYEKYRQNGFHVHVVAPQEMIVCGQYNAILFYNTPSDASAVETDIRVCYGLLEDDGVMYFAKYIDIHSDGTPFITQSQLDELLCHCGFNVTSHSEHVEFPSPCPQEVVDLRGDLYLAKMTRARTALDL